MMRTFTNVNIGVVATDVKTINTIQNELSTLGAYYDTEGSDSNTFNINSGFDSEEEAKGFVRKWKDKVDYLETETFSIEGLE
jgi:hypothetical protein